MPRRLKKKGLRDGSKMVTQEELIDIFKNYLDPELGIDIWTLGLIYKTEINDTQVKVLLTFTSPMCPYGPQMVTDLKEQIEKLGVQVEMEVTFDPPWKPTDELREMLGV